MKFDDCFILSIQRGEKIYSFRFSSHNNEVFEIGGRKYRTFVVQIMSFLEVLNFISKKGFNPLHFGFSTFEDMSIYYQIFFAKRNAKNDDFLYLHTW